MINLTEIKVANICSNLSMITVNVFTSVYLDGLCQSQNSKNEIQNEYIMNVGDVAIIKDTLKIWELSESLDKLKN